MRSGPGRIAIRPGLIRFPPVIHDRFNGSGQFRTSSRDGVAGPRRSVRGGRLDANFEHDVISHGLPVVVVPPLAAVQFPCPHGNRQAELFFEIRICARARLAVGFWSEPPTCPAASRHRTVNSLEMRATIRTKVDRTTPGRSTRSGRSTASLQHPDATLPAASRSGCYVTIWKTSTG